MINPLQVMYYSIFLFLFQYLHVFVRAFFLIIFDFAYLQHLLKKADLEVDLNIFCRN